MKNFKGKVAVVTGAASGIGYALAEEFLKRGTHVVLADVDQESLAGSIATLSSEYDAQCVGIDVDVSKRESVEALAESVFSMFGAVHFLCNNAGVGAGFDIGNTSYDDFEWVLGVNLWGVIYGVKTFLPLMEKQEEECHIVNTASTAGIVAGYGSIPYAVSKHGIVALSEAVFFDLEERGSNTGISVLCPYATATRIIESDRNRPENLSEKSKLPTSEKQLETLGKMFQSVVNGVKPEEIAKLTMTAIDTKQFYIVPTDELNESITERGRAIVSGANPEAKLTFS